MWNLKRALLTSHGYLIGEMSAGLCTQDARVIICLSPLLSVFPEIKNK